MRILKYFWKNGIGDIKFAPQIAKDSVSEHTGEGLARMQHKCKQNLLIFIQNDLRGNSDKRLHIKYLLLKRNDI